MVYPGRFALEEVAGGLHSKKKALITANCKARQGCRKRASPASLGACVSAEPPLGGRRASVLHTSPSSW